MQQFNNYCCNRTGRVELRMGAFMGRDVGQVFRRRDRPRWKYFLRQGTPCFSPVEKKVSPNYPGILISRWVEMINNSYKKTPGWVLFLLLFLLSSLLSKYRRNCPSFQNQPSFRGMRIHPQRNNHHRPRQGKDRCHPNQVLAYSLRPRNCRHE